VVEWVIAPLVPLTVNVYVPVAAGRLTETPRVEVPEVVIEAGVKVAFVFFGKPLRLRVTVPENGPTAPMVTV
jgi:hypothetical protein